MSVSPVSSGSSTADIQKAFEAAKAAAKVKAVAAAKVAAKKKAAAAAKAKAQAAKDKAKSDLADRRA